MSDGIGLMEKLELGGELARLCRAHDIPAEMVGNSHDLDGLLDQVTAACEAELGTIDPSDATTAATLGRLSKWIGFTHRASKLRRGTEETPAIVSSIEDLERIRTGGGQGTDRDVAFREAMQEVFDTLTTLCHQINNPLTALLGRAQILQINRTTDPKVLKAADVIEESADRVAGLVRETAGVVLRGKEQLKS